MLRRLLACAALAAAAPAFADGPAAKLDLSFEGRTVSLTAGEIAALPHRDVEALDGHDKKTHRYSGVPVRDLLARVGAPFGEKLRGKALRDAVVARSVDGYAVLFALAEFDPTFRSGDILLVDAQDGQKLPPGLAPFRLMAPGDARPARWARMVTRLDVIAVP